MTLLAGGSDDAEISALSKVIAVVSCAWEMKAERHFLRPQDSYHKGKAKGSKGARKILKTS
jgi:hypothetical protein